MLTFEEDSKNRVLIVTVKGFIEKENIDFYLKHLNRRLNDWDKVKIVKVIEQFDGIDFKSFCRVLWVYLKNLKKIEKCAFITHNVLSGWQGLLGGFFSIVGSFLSFFLICEFKRFSFRKVEQAKIWLEDTIPDDVDPNEDQGNKA